MRYTVNLENGVIIAPSELMLRDDRVTIGSSGSLDAMSPREVRIRQEFAGYLLGGYSAPEAVYLALGVNNGEPPGITPKLWKSWWNRARCESIAALWMRDPAVLAVVTDGKRTAVALAHGLAPGLAPAGRQNGNSTRISTRISTDPLPKWY